MTDDYDLVVLGAGATGLGAAREGRRKGRSVALVEVARPGGDCTHYGCVPSKALLETARRVQAARSGGEYGFTADVQVDFRAVMERVARVVADVEQDESPEQLASEGIDLLRGWGVVTGPTSLEVDGRLLRELVVLLRQQSLSALDRFSALSDSLRSLLGEAPHARVCRHLDGLRFIEAAEALEAALEKIQVP